MRPSMRLRKPQDNCPARSNPVAKALASPLFRHRMVKSKKGYSRKVKNKCCIFATLD